MTSEIDGPLKVYMCSLGVVQEIYLLIVLLKLTPYMGLNTSNSFNFILSSSFNFKDEFSFAFTNQFYFLTFSFFNNLIRRDETRRDAHQFTACRKRTMASKKGLLISDEYNKKFDTVKVTFRKGILLINLKYFVTY